MEAMKASLLGAAGAFTFSKESVVGYVARGRLFATSAGRAVSLVHPLGFCLAFDRILASGDMQSALAEIASMPARARPAVHLWRAPEDCGESCAAAAPGVAGGVEWIKARFEEGAVHDCVFPGAGPARKTSAPHATRARYMAAGGGDCGRVWSLTTKILYSEIFAILVMICADFI